MRVPNLTTTDTLLRNLQSLDRQQLKLQQQASDGQKISLAHEDPTTMSRVLRLETDKREMVQFRRNAGHALDVSNASFSALQKMEDLVSRTMEITSLTRSGLNPNAFATYAKEVEQIKEEALVRANSSFNGKFLFGGAADDVRPYDDNFLLSGKEDISNSFPLDTITITGGDDGDTFNVTIDGHSLGTATDWDTDVATTATNLAAAINADGTLSAIVTADASAQDGSLTLIAKEGEFTAASIASEGASSTDVGISFFKLSEAQISERDQLIANKEKALKNYPGKIAEWSSSTTYKAGDSVKEAGTDTVFQAVDPKPGVPPSSDSDPNEWIVHPTISFPYGRLDDGTQITPELIEKQKEEVKEKYITDKRETYRQELITQHQADLVKEYRNKIVAAKHEVYVAEDTKISPYLQVADTDEKDFFASFFENLKDLEGALNEASQGYKDEDEATINTGVTIINTVGKNLLKTEDKLIENIGDMSAIVYRIETAKSHDDEWFLQVENRISTEVDADITETIVKLNQSRTAYQAALQTGVDLFSMTLLQYI